MLNDELNFHRRALIAAGLAFAIVFIVWNVPQLNVVLYPLRLFVTFVHESGHGLAAIATGGQLQGFVVNSDGTGFARTSGGSLLVILPAGYLGAAFFGAGLFFLANTVRFTRTVSVALGAILIAITILYTDLLSVAFIVGALSGLVLILLGWRGGGLLNLIVLNCLSLMTALHGVLDLIYLVNNSGARMGTIRNDAEAFSQAVAPLVPAAVWAALWAGIAIAAVCAAVYFSILRRLWRRSPAAERGDPRRY